MSNMTAVMIPTVHPKYHGWTVITEITQTSSLVLKEDEKATLTCSQNDDHESMYWYLQQPGKGLQLIYYSIGANLQQEGDIPAGYKANRLNKENFNLDILSAKMNHSGVYFCASSLDTTLQSHLLSLQKLLSFPAASLRRELLSAQQRVCGPIACSQPRYC
uniref:Ig-like domain-containing protein n=1 Tax=Calidris pygmaea TaxID=425635 RepID=A0A8C3JLJ6_9CHAR